MYSFKIYVNNIRDKLSPISFKIQNPFESTLFDAAEIEANFYVNPTSVNDDEATSFAFIGMSDIDSSNMEISSYSSIPKDKAKGYSCFQKNDLLFAKITPCMENGKIALVEDVPTNICFGSTEFNVFREIDANKASVKYLKYLFSIEQFRKYLKANFSGAAGQQRIAPEFMKKTTIPVPGPDIQNEIVSIMDRAIENKKAMETEAESLLLSIDEYLLSELGIALLKVEDKKRIFKIEAEKLKNSRVDVSYNNPYFYALIDALAETKYAFKELEGNIDFIAGYAFSSDDYQLSGTKLLTIGNIKQNGIDLDNCSYLSKYFEEKYSRFIIQKGDIVFAMTGATIGKCSIFDKDDTILLNQRVGIIRCHNNLNNVFICSLLNLNVFKSLILRNSVGGAQPNISETNITSMKLPIPDDINIQNKIANEIQCRISKAKSLKDQATQQYKQAKQKVENILLGKK